LTDSAILSFHFTDGNGDIGLDDAELDPPLTANLTIIIISTLVIMKKMTLTAGSRDLIWQEIQSFLNTVLSALKSKANNAA
jgi:hypothetical protein